MRLLKNLVSDLFRDSTGFDPWRSVRRIGGGKTLPAGGAALELSEARRRQLDLDPEALHGTDPSDGPPSA